MKDKKHGVQLLIRVVVKDPDGKVISDTKQKPAKSYVIQFLEFIHAQGVGEGNIPATDTSGAEQIIYAAPVACGIMLMIDAAVNVSTHGIVIGTGDTAVTNEDYTLETQLTEGIGAGNITHGVVVIGTAEVVGANVDLEIKRSFTNNTGSTITVKEAGVYVFNDPRVHCIIRDVLSPAKDVPDNCSITVYYTIRTTV